MLRACHQRIEWSGRWESNPREKSKAHFKMRWLWSRQTSTCDSRVGNTLFKKLYILANGLFKPCKATNSSVVSSNRKSSWLRRSSRVSARANAPIAVFMITMPARHRHRHFSERGKSITVTMGSCLRSVGIRVHAAITHLAHTLVQ